MQYLCFPSKLKHHFDGIPAVNFDEINAILHLAKMYSFGKKEFLVIEIHTPGFALDPRVAEIQKIKKKIKMG
jgi:hypothetical protein